MIILRIAPPEPKTQKKYEADDKKDMELVRRWRMVIEDIEITNKTSRLMNPFIRFTIGGDYYVDIKELANKSKIYLPHGEKGVVQMTHVLRYLEPGMTEVFSSVIESSIQSSYFQLMEEHVHIEVWDKNGFLLNSWLGYESLLLFDVANGNMR